MRLPMPALRRFLIRAALLAALCLWFRSLAPGQALALRDEAVSVSVLTADGPVVMTMAEYLPHAVAAEMPVSFGPEALKAQAVAARSYVLASHRHEDAAVCTDSGCCLAYWDTAELRDRWGEDYEKNLAAVTAAVRDTDGQALTYEGQVIQAVFHASSAGATEDSGAVWAPIPYLISVSSPETPENDRDLISRARFSPAELAERLGLSPEEPPADWITGIRRDDAGRAETLSIAGQVLSAGFVRSALGLKSTAFDAVWDGESFVFTTAGHGHGVGMSQVGAKLLGAEGWTYDRILAHYYPGTELVTP